MRASFAGNARPNTDDHPEVVYRAPRFTHAPDSTPGDRVATLLGLVSAAPAELLEPTADAAWPTRLAEYFDARKRFMEAGRSVEPSADVAHMLAQVREPLLAVLRTSPDFRPAYNPLLRMAVALAGRDKAVASELLRELARMQPQRAEAVDALRRLGEAP